MNDNNIKLRFVVTSDIHYKENSDVEKERFEKGMKMAYEYAKSTSYPKIDAFFAVGDFANSGSFAEMTKFKASLDKVILPETKITLMLASHEFRVEGGQHAAEQQLLEIFGQKPDNYFEIAGCPFVCLSTEDGCRIKEDKQKYLKACLEDSVKNGRKKPVFVFQHPHLTDTVYGSINWGDDDIIAILTDYPQVIDFSGHSHAPINDSRSIHQNYFTSLGTGSFAYFELDEYDFMYGTVPPDCKECAQFYIVEVDTDNAVKIIPVDVLSNSFFFDGYEIDTCWEPDSFIYTNSRALSEPKPYFDEDFKINALLSDDNKLTVQFPQAKTDGYRVDSYSVSVRDCIKGEVLFQKKIASSYYIKNMPEMLRLETEFPFARGEYIFEVVANGFWIVKSDKFTAKITL